MTSAYADGMQDVDLGVCKGHFFASDPSRVAILLPGAYYLPAAPLLWFGREALQANGWSVLQVWDQRSGGVDAQQWVDDRLQAALAHVGSGPRRLVLAKSLTSLALPAVAALGLPGVWLTPLLSRDNVRSGLASSQAPTLAIGGGADPTWDSKFAASLSDVEIVEIAQADHSLQLPGDTARSLEMLGAVTLAIDSFVARLG